MKSDDELKKENPDLYRIARERGTEAPFSGTYHDSKEKGMYRCAVCDTQLFSSSAKFDSGTGWPSFADPVAQEAILLRDDATQGMHRTEVVCKHCGAHLGHVFSDGPEEMGGKRYCINSVCLALDPDKKTT